jgi:hypothetical protein
MTCSIQMKKLSFVAIKMYSSPRHLGGWGFLQQQISTCPDNLSPELNNLYAAEPRNGSTLPPR